MASAKVVNNLEKSLSDPTIDPKSYLNLVAEGNSYKEK